MDYHLRTPNCLFVVLQLSIVILLFPGIQATFKVYLFQPNTNLTEDQKLLMKVDDWCSTNGSYCLVYGPNCECGQDEGNYHCVCPSALDYTLRLASGIAIILLVGVTIMLAFTLYRRARILRRRSSRNQTDNSDSSHDSVVDPPPLYTEINIVSSPTLDATDFEKLPTYDEALEYLKNVGANSGSTTIMVLNTEIFLNRSESSSSSKGDCSSPAPSGPETPPPTYSCAVNIGQEGGEDDAPSLSQEQPVA